MRSWQLSEDTSPVRIDPTEMELQSHRSALNLKPENETIVFVGGPNGTKFPRCLLANENDHLICQLLKTLFFEALRKDDDDRGVT